MMNDSPAYNSVAVILPELQRQFTDRVSVDPEILNDHGHDVSRHETQAPQAVVFPTSTEEVAAIVRLCHQHRVPVIPFGTATAVEGGVVAIHGGVAIDLMQMNSILEVNTSDADATVQAGVTRYQLNNSLEAEGNGLVFTVDPGADASIGGMAATRASGSSAVRYGTMRDNTLALTVVLPDGEIIKTGGRARKSSAGYDLTHLMVGSEGTLGIITEVTVKLHPKPEQVSSAVCPFPSIESAVDAVIEILAAGIPVARIELLDEVQIDAVNKYSGLSNVLLPTIFFEFHGSTKHVLEQTTRAEAITAQHGATEFQWAVDQQQRDRLWQARYDSFHAVMALRENAVGYVTDVCVPISELARCFLHAKEIVKDATVPAPVFGHVGDGNFHVVFPLDPDRPAELAEVTGYHQQLIDMALSVGGTCTGEHGIGLGKREALKQEHGQAVDTMKRIKLALDPLNIMNPGKVV
ncbi:MAG: FAD-binding oxidoreductase [Planctomycetaceae bacterium]|nr:FAD-binding oxidoreductase [Planctomycetaceae bacterium]